MSLCLRFGATSLVAPPTLGLVLPRLPSLRLLFPQKPTISIDPRLEELKRQIEEDGEAPFMIDNGMILRAAPKKRTSHRRRREKLYASGDKKIKPLENLVRCPACGHVKRSHFMCMHCFAEIKTFLKEKKKALFPEPKNPQQDLDPVDERLVYPARKLKRDELEIKKKDWVPQREEPLMYSKEHTRKRY
ncbi:ribosomal protein L32 [Candidozyma pseudohaemuli]|uniref:Large ribosomal subunit protein bL32m n=1 Tax=Candidozyma pseudohaemuli TaxID=418784 RepID=A0A2P7YMH7_9ASCO|nr:ribosomal protein L32 [[Candida] pseudohaemulonii]PSK37159.1 ribosomal protein L32 [[Candida] pseudohaemulonii]